jgi:STE24 endopeptidase
MKLPMQILGLAAAGALTSGLLFAQTGAPGASLLNPAATETPTPIEVPAAAQAGPGAFDVKAATDAWLAKVPPDKRAASDAYFEGGYWLILWDFLYGAAVSLLLLAAGLSARMRNLAERLTRFKAVHAFAYWTQYVVITSLLGFPLAAYEGYFREHQYGLSNQSFGPWLEDQLKGLMLGVILGGLFAIALYAVVRRLPRSWWIWGALVTLGFGIFSVVISPVYLAPLFNTYKKLEDPRIRDPILSLARANGIHVDDVYQVDASRQSKRVSANVSGLFGTERITLNDNLLNRCTPEEIQAVMGHEMGHYVLNHIYIFILFFGVLIVAGFAYLRGALEWASGRWGAAWGLRGPLDLAVVPLAALLLSSFFLVLTPFVNSFIRMQEFEADMYGLNAARQPDGEAQVDLMLGEYRKLDPGPLEEWIFFDHPSGRTRIRAAMQWKAENLRTGGTE